MTEKVQAYLITDLLVEPSEHYTVPEGYVAEPSVGSVLLRMDNPGTGEHSFGLEDGAIQLTATGTYVATGFVDEPGGPVLFDLGTQRVLNLISLGLGAEQILRAQIHEFAEQVQGKLEEILTNDTRLRENLCGDSLRAVDYLEKHFFDRKGC